MAEKGCIMVSVNPTSMFLVIAIAALVTIYYKITYNVSFQEAFLIVCVGIRGMWYVFWEVWTLSALFLMPVQVITYVVFVIAFTFTVAKLIAMFLVCFYKYIKNK